MCRVQKNVQCKHSRFGYQVGYYTLNARSRVKLLVLWSRESWCFPRQSQGKHQDSRENKTNWFPEGPDIKCFVIFLDFHFNSNKLTGANQNSPLGTYNNTNLILIKPNEWFTKFFPHIICMFFHHKLLFLFWDDLRLCVYVVFIHENATWQCFSRILSHHFPPCFDYVL